MEKYRTKYAISKIGVSTKHVHERFKNMNRGKTYEMKIKPFNFALVGVAQQKTSMRSDAKHIKPLAPYSDNPQAAVYGEFIDYETGNVIPEGIEHWLSLSQTIQDYMKHDEVSLDGEIGWLQRKHIIADDIVYIGKEAREVLLGDDFYTQYPQQIEFPQIEEIAKKGTKSDKVSKQVRRYWRTQIKEGKQPQPYHKTKKKLVGGETK